jgi:hypothetical protein
MELCRCCLRLSKRRYEHGPSRNGTLNGQLNTNFVTVQSALVEAKDRDQIEKQGLKLRKRGEGKGYARVIWREEWFIWHL